MAEQIEIVDIQARQDIAVIKSSLDKIDRTLNNIFVALVTGLGGAAGASAWNWLSHPH